MSNINELTTETSNENSKNIDELKTVEIVKLINLEDAKVALAVEKEIPYISNAVDEVAKRFKNGGRIIYAGAGSSGRMGTLDAVELTPTYNVPPKRAFGLMAGGKKAMYMAIEGAEDSKDLAVSDLRNVKLNELDSLISIAASGRTPYAIGALEYANEIGALTISITCNKESEMAKIAKISIAPIVGPEIISGSTRMKAGTAEKMILNMISTGVMIKLGKVYGNYMVNAQPTNKKLIERAVNMVSKITGLNLKKSEELFNDADKNVALAIVMYRTEASKELAYEALKKSDNHVRIAIKMIKDSSVG